MPEPLKHLRLKSELRTLLWLLYADSKLLGTTTVNAMPANDDYTPMSNAISDPEALANGLEKVWLARNARHFHSHVPNFSCPRRETMTEALHAVLPGRPPNAHRSTYAKASAASSTSLLLTENDELPPKKYPQPFRALRWSWMTIYQRLCLIVCLPNLIAVILLSIRHNVFRIPLPDIATAVAANATVAVLMRQELVINLLFKLSAKCPRTAPLRLRRILAKVYHFGGIHSGAGIATAVWFTILNGTLLWRWRADTIPGLAKEDIHFVIFITILIDFLLILMIIFAHPELRRVYHNAFEAIHRFAGWSIVILFWIHSIALTNVLERAAAAQSPDQPVRPLGAALIRNPSIYLLFVITISLILPWLRLRRVPVQIEHLSSHASRWHFSYTNIELCAATRFTDKPLKEWHSFAGIPEPDGNGFSVVVSNAGDWTSRMIHNPPKKLWVRGLPTFGVLHMATVFNRVVLVATGSGIGPIMSLLTARDMSCRILWSARDPLNTYSKDIMDEVYLADPAAMVLDSKKFGAGSTVPRPDLLRLTYGLYRESNAEAVFVISNQKVTDKLIFGLESRGVPAFAPIFDS